VPPDLIKINTSQATDRAITININTCSATVMFVSSGLLGFSRQAAETGRRQRHALPLAGIRSICLSIARGANSGGSLAELVLDY
jgi:hypothetical protein